MVYKENAATLQFAKQASKQQITTDDTKNTSRLETNAGEKQKKSAHHLRSLHEDTKMQKNKERNTAIRSPGFPRSTVVLMLFDI